MLSELLSGYCVATSITLLLVLSEHTVSCQASELVPTLNVFSTRQATLVLNQTLQCLYH